MATTTNYSWTTPDDTDLVKNGASAIRTLGTAIDTTTKNLNPSTTLGDIEYRSSTANTNTRLGIGSSGQNLQVVAGVPSWAASSTSTLTTTGDLLYASAANTLARRGIGSTGQVLTVAGGVPTWANASSGLTFTQRKVETGEQIFTIAHNGSNMYVAGGASGALYSSPDAITWTSRTSGFGANQITKIAYGNGLFVAVGENGTLTTSSDGITWTARTANMSTNTIYSVIYANSTWVAVGDGGGATNTGGIIYSTDGTTWTRKSQTPTVGTIYFDVIWNGTNWVVGASNSTNNYLYATTPSGTWTAAASGLAQSMKGLIWDGTRTIVMAISYMYFSTTTTLSINGTTSRYYNVATTEPWNWYYYNSKIYLLNSAYLDQITPASTRGVMKQTPVISPTSYGAGSSTLYGSGNAIFVNASGIIVASDTAGIWTSF